MTTPPTSWWERHVGTWTCLRGWGRLVCIADDLAHMLHLPGMVWLCELHDRRLMRTMGDENDVHTETIRQWWNTAAATTTVPGDVTITYRSQP